MARWFEHLDPQRNAAPWTAEEDNLLLSTYQARRLLPAQQNLTRQDRLPLQLMVERFTYSTYQPQLDTHLDRILKRTFSSTFQ